MSCYSAKENKEKTNWQFSDVVFYAVPSRVSRLVSPFGSLFRQLADAFCHRHVYCRVEWYEHNSVPFDTCCGASNHNTCNTVHVLVCLWPLRLSLDIQTLPSNQLINVSKLF